MKLVSVREMQAIEREADASGLSYAEMMENAGLGLAERVLFSYSQLGERKALGLVGSGNNGGDTLVALAHLAFNGWKTSAYLVRARPADDPLMARLKDQGGVIATAEGDQSFSRLAELLRTHTVVLDGVLGTGIRLPLKPEVAAVLDFTRQFLSSEGKTHVVAVDCPSGIDCDTGEAAPECVPAERTVTMAAVKQGLLKFPAFKLVGSLEMVGIGLAEEDGSLGPNPPAWRAVKRFVPDRVYVRTVLPARPLDAHKGTFGTALVVAGSVNYSGAALLAGRAAYRSGAGLVTLAVPEPLHAALAGHFAEATWAPLPDVDGFISADGVPKLIANINRATALLIGPGLGQEDTTRGFLDELLNAGQSRAAIPLPGLVIDADGLKLLASLEGWPRRLASTAVLTPHPGEMAILTGLKTAEIQADRLRVAEQFAREWGHVVVLKGAFTVVAAPDGRTAVIPVASPALARAGSGDVLGGLIAGLRAQGVEDFQASSAGAWIHAQAGLRAAERIGSTAAVLAGDLIQGMITVLAELQVAGR
jgi:NAD(P)H-hydrate epimerase